jgi:hypothetical protein
MTSEMIFRASKNFRIPYTSLGNLRNDILHLHAQGFIGRQKIPSENRGQKEYLYFPAKGVRRLPELKDLSLPDSAFRGFSGSQWHSEATSEFVSHFERSAGELKPRVKTLAAIRDGYFTATLHMNAQENTTSLKPDYTLVADINGEVCLLFVEIFNNPALVNPLSPQSVGRSVRFKMSKYKMFQQALQQHPVVADLQSQFNCRFHGFRVLTVTTRSDSHKNSLVAWAKKDGFQTMFYFASMDGIRSANLFGDPVWSLPNGTKRGLTNI